MIIMEKYILEKQRQNMQIFVDDKIDEIVEQLIHKSEDIQEIRLLRKNLKLVEEIYAILGQKTHSDVNDDKR